MYIIAFIWLVSNVICLYIARKRGVSPGLSARFLAVFLGPLAIPLALSLKPKAYS